MLSSLVHTFGVLRLFLVATVLFLIAISPYTDATVVFDDAFKLVTTLVAPAFYVIIVFVLPLDMTMTRVFMAGKSQTDKSRLARVFWTEALLFVLLILSWLPFLLSLFRFR